MSKNDDFDDFVNRLQEEIDKKEKEIYSDEVLEEYHHPKNLGALSDEECDAFGEAASDSCGDNMLMYLKVKDNVIIDIKFRTDGCGVTTAVGSRLTTLVKGKTIEDAKQLSAADLEKSLGGLPKEHTHCTRLGIAALTNAIENYLKIV